jgi:C1A family cysteine protease
MDSEERQGGHAMCVCGYTTIYDVNYFLVINSWGEEFAKENPLGLPGYALIPESYIAKPGLVGELLLPIDT